MNKLTARKKAAPILALLLSLAASAAQDWRSKPLDKVTPKDVDQMLTDPQVITFPMLYRIYMIKQLLPGTAVQKLWDMVDAAERRANRRLNQPGRTYLMCTGKNDPSYCQPFYTPDLVRVINYSRDFMVELNGGLLSVFNFEAPGKQYIAMNILPKNVELYAVYPAVSPRPIAEWSKMSPTSLFPGDHADWVLLFAPQPGDQLGVFRLLVGNYSCEFLVNLKRE